MSRIPPHVISEALHNILHEGKTRKFPESIELQIVLKNYDVTKDKRFSGTLRLPHMCRPRLKVGIIADLGHQEAAQRAGIATITMDDLRTLNKEKKLIKKLCRQYGCFLASESLIRTLPRVVGPHMNKANKFPTAIAATDNITDRITDMQSTIKFQLKKVLCLGCVVGSMGITEDDLRQNVVTALNFLVSLLKKNWQNMRAVYVKSSMGKPRRIY